MPLRERGELIGLLILASRSIDKFEATEVTLISTVAEQISAAIANARLFEEAQHRAEELSILYDVGHMLTSTLRSHQSAARDHGSRRQHAAGGSRLGAAAG